MVGWVGVGREEGGGEGEEGAMQPRDTEGWGRGGVGHQRRVAEVLAVPTASEAGRLEKSALSYHFWVMFRLFWFQGLRFRTFRLVEFFGPWFRSSHLVSNSSWKADDRVAPAGVG